jgi:tetratricopeptide (TPR) repeat protein
VEIEKLRKVSSREINQALSRWDLPESPPTASSRTTGKEMESELAMLNWLYDLIRRNVKRGRIFQLRDVLLHQQADCLGYAKLLNRLGQRFALDIGIVEVVIDNGGRYTPHYINLLRFFTGRRQFMDLWYGSRDVRHRRIGAQVKEGRRWRIKDLDWDGLEKVEDIRGLPSTSVDGITHYILGNRHLEKGIRDAEREELDRAIAHYSKALNLYPGYARAYFNRAIAYENEGEYEKARLDYALALRDEASQIRVLATEHEEVIQLMELDRANIGMKEQEIYLLRRGFITGEQMASADIAKRYGISESQVDDIISAIEAGCALTLKEAT